MRGGGGHSVMCRMDELSCPTQARLKYVLIYHTYLVAGWGIDVWMYGCMGMMDGRRRVWDWALDCGLLE